MHPRGPTANKEAVFNIWEEKSPLNIDHWVNLIWEMVKFKNVSYNIGMGLLASGVLT